MSPKRLSFMPMYDIDYKNIIITRSVVYWRQGEAGRRPGSSHNLKKFF